MKATRKVKSNTVKVIDGVVLKRAKIVCIQKNYTIQQYVTEAIKEKNDKEKKSI